MKLEFKHYRKNQTQEMRAYVPGEDLTGISVGAQDTPEEGGMIARNPKNHADQWYVAKQFFAENYEPATQARFCDYKGELVERDGKMVCPACGNS